MKDKPGVQFLLTTVIGGLVFLVPVAFISYIIIQVVAFMKVVAQPLADWLPVDSVGGIALANLLAIAALIVICFLSGLIARHTIMGGMVKKLDSLLINVPGYSIVRGIKSGFDDTETEKMRPVALQLGTAERIAFEMQKLEDGRSMVYIPSNPSAWSGITQILPADQITYIDIPVTKVIELTEKFGHGVETILAAKRKDES
jgi:uncharacterized membrane protein